jgi:hypothetical protein
MAKDRIILNPHVFYYPDSFLKEHHFKPHDFPGHSYDILTNNEIIEIDDLDQHSHKKQKINDGVAGEYAINHLSKFKFYRLLKEEICNRRGHIEDLDKVKRYLKDNLF